MVIPIWRSPGVGEGQEKLQEYLEQVYKAGERARDLIQQMMAYSRNTEADMMILDPRPLIRETVKMLRSTLPASIQLNFDSLPDDEPVSINMEPVQLQQIVMNLCVNARDAMHGQGQLDLRLETIHHQIQVECTSCHEAVQGDYVALSVRDSGDGMASDMLDHLFEPFFTTKEVGEGTGLGLSVVHGIMHDHQGHIRVESRAGQGTAFYLLFPLLAESVVGENELVEIAHDVVESPDEASGSVVGKRILVVDDEPSVLGFLQAWLKRKGFDVQAYGDSREAWAYFETHQDEVDLLITDQTMPEVTGKELIQKVLTLQPQLPTILCSGYTDQISDEQAARLGIRHFAEKPFNHKQFLGVIEQLLNEPRAEVHSSRAFQIPAEN